MPTQGLLEQLKLPKTRKLVLLAIKEHGQMTADQLAAMLEISTVAVRRHLENLKNSGMVQYEEVQNGVGRPSFVYTLTTAAEGLFPRNYQSLANDVLNTVRELYGDEAVDAIFHKRLQQTLAYYRPHVTGQTLPKRVAQLVELRQQDGYMATWKAAEDNTLVVTELNCPIQQVAGECRQACQNDLHLYTELLDAEVIPLTRRFDDANQHKCSYAITPKLD